MDIRSILCVPHTKEKSSLAVLYNTCILSRTCMGHPIHVWDVPYAYGMVLLSNTRIGVLYAYGIEIVITFGLRKRCKNAIAS